MPSKPWLIPFFWLSAITTNSISRIRYSPIAKDSNLNALRNSAQGQFTRGLMAEVIKTAINYIEKNRKKLHD